MFFLFGVYPIPIKGYEPPNSSGFKYELVVYVFHLFLIPLFPIRKDWILSIEGKEDAKVDKKTSNELTAIHGKGKSPWYAYSWFILFPVLLLGYNLNKKIWYNKINSNAFTISDQKRYNEKQNQIGNPSVDDYYIIEPGYCNSRSYHSTIFKVAGFTDDSIRFQIPLDKNWKGRYAGIEWKQYFSNKSIKFKFRFISKKDLILLSARREGDLEKYSKKVLRNITGGKCIYIEKILKRP